ncbi:MAG: AAC(3) family N-acetyltransferase [Actinomycetota bacterium]|nr:AAC(3) family N-acetyltransferase [Actinomycetota bacterium]
MSATVVHSVIDRTPEPVTHAAICTALAAAGVSSGASVIVHSSLSRIGWVVGGAHTVVGAVLDAVGPDGTVTMPSMSSDLSDPARWEAPPVPESWWQTIREQTPAFDVHLTPTTHMGAVVECFRHVPGAVRSAHPADSFVSVGPLAPHVAQPHPLSPAFGDGSPLSRLYELDARIVLLGVGHSNNTSLHLAEWRAAQASMPATIITYGAPVMRDGARQWVEFEDLDYDADDFAALGDAFAADGGEVQIVPLGVGDVTTCSMREIVDFGVSWLCANRPQR